MSDDVVKMLRAKPLYESHGEESELPDEAADEIERLRAKVEDWIANCDILLTQLDWVCGAAGFPLEGEDSGLVEVIRAALEGKDEK